ncbi:hypothetical protein HK097_004460, partial [Rhizophlyctis rosea]
MTDSTDKYKDRAAARRRGPGNEQVRSLSPILISKPSRIFGTQRTIKVSPKSPPREKENIPPGLEAIADNPLEGPSQQQDSDSIPHYTISSSPQRVTSQPVRKARKPQPQKTKIPSEEPPAEDRPPEAAVNTPKTRNGWKRAGIQPVVSLAWGGPTKVSKKARPNNPTSPSSPDPIIEFSPETRKPLVKRKRLKKSNDPSSPAKKAKTDKTAREDLTVDQEQQ